MAWIADSRTGWRSLDEDAGLSAVERSPARPPGSRRNPSRSAVTRRATTSATCNTRTASRSSAAIAPTSPLRSASLSTPGVRGRRARGPDRPCDRGPRSRGLASPRRKRRGNDRVLRASDRGGAGPAAGARRRHGAPHDGSAARREHARGLEASTTACQVNVETADASTSIRTAVLPVAVSCLAALEAPCARARSARDPRPRRPP